MQRAQAKVETPGLDIIIPAFGLMDELGRCLEALDESAAFVERAFSVHIVDDRGPEPIRKDRLPKLETLTLNLYRNTRNLGFPQTCNAGAFHGSKSLLLFLNTDVELEPEALSFMIDEFEDSEVGVVGIKLLFPRGSTNPKRPAGQIQHAGVALGFDGKPFHIHIGWPADHPRANKHQEMQFVTGAVFMTRRSLWNEVGGFAEVYGRGTYEDIEYCVAIRSLGFKVIYQPAAVAYHAVGASAIAARVGFNTQRNEMIWRIRCGELAFWDSWRFW